jgi:hypothetical protein
MKLTLTDFRREAAFYAGECRAEGKEPRLLELAQRMGFHRGYFTHSSDDRRRKKLAVLEEWAALGVGKVSSRLQPLYAQVGQLPDLEEPIVLPQIPPPPDEEIPTVINTSGRYEMFCQLWQDHGPEAAMAYAQVCASPAQRGAHYYPKEPKTYALV